MNDKGYIGQMLGEHEQILVVARQHWFMAVAAIIAEVVVILLLLILVGGVTAIIPDNFIIPRWLPALLGALVVLIPLVNLVLDIIKWWNRQYLVTTHRVIQIYGAFNKNVIDSSLEKVNDIKLTQSVFGRLFDYGDIEILTASEMGINLFRQIGEPIHFKIAMLNAKEKLEHGVRGDESVPRLIAQLEQLRKTGILTETEFQNKKSDLLTRL